MSGSSNKGPSAGGNSKSAWSRPLGGGVRGQRPPPGLDGGGARPGSWGTPSSSSLNGKFANTSEANARQILLVLRERFLHLILSMVGQSVTLMTKDGRVIEGTLHTFTPFANLANEATGNVYVVKACHEIGGIGMVDDKIVQGSTVVIPAHKVSSVMVKSMRLGGMAADTLTGKVVDTFQIDSQISGGKGTDHNLIAAGIAWTTTGDVDEVLGGMRGADTLNWRAAATRGDGQRPSAIDSVKLSFVGGGLDETIGDWDQFSANENKFNVKASFDENLYTTKLDMSSIDLSRREEAERIAREIVSQTSTNMHVAEERNQASDTDFDEEDRYSGVLTNDLKVRAVVPASGVQDIGGEKKLSVPGKVMNYAAAAQAAAKKGSAAESAASATASAPFVAVSKLYEDNDEASSADKLPPPLLLSKMANASLEKRSFDPISANSLNDAESSDEKDNVIVVDIHSKKVGPQENDKNKAAATTSSIKLNPNAKAFMFNPTAKTFTPSFATPPPPIAAVHQPMLIDAQQIMTPHHGSVDYSGVSQNMGSGSAQLVSMHSMIPTINGQHSQMRQKYQTPYGQLLPPQHPAVGLPGQEDASSVTGESSETAPPHQPQYMQQIGAYGVIPSGSYPGYHYGQMQSQEGRGGGPPPPGVLRGYQGQSVPGHSQMQVPPGANPYGSQRIYAPVPYQQHMINSQQIGVPLLGVAAAANIMRVVPPSPYFSVGPGMGYGIGFPQHGGGYSDHDNSVYRDRNSSMQQGGGGGSFGGRSRHKGKGKAPGRSYQHQNSQSSHESRHHQINDACPNKDDCVSGGDAPGDGNRAELSSTLSLDRGEALKEVGE